MPETLPYARDLAEKTANGELWVQEGLRILDGLDERPTLELLMTLSEVWRPLRSVAGWFLWRLTDQRRYDGL